MKTAEFAPFDPSTAHLWGHCGLSPAMVARYPQERSIDSEEGTAAHEYVTDAFVGRVFEAGLDLAENGVVISQEMIDGGEAILDDLNRHKRIFAMTTGRPEIMTSTYLSAVFIHPTECRGPADFFAVDWANRVIYVWEYKFGHRYVEEFRNPQGICYFNGAMAYVGLDWDKAIIEGWRFRFLLAQPRCFDPRGSLREWIVDAADLLVESVKLQAATVSDRNLASTGDHCLLCPGAHACPALRQVGGACIDISRRSVPEDLDEATIGLELKFLMEAQTRLDSRLDALTEQAMALVKRGKTVPHVSVVQGQGRETWSIPDEEAISIASALGVDISKVGTITPKQAYKLVEDVETKDALEALTFTPPGKAKIRPLDEIDILKAFK